MDRAGGVCLVEKGIVSEDKRKPVLDERALSRLLEAAFIVQEHNREVGVAETVKKKRSRVNAEDRVAAAQTAPTVSAKDVKPQPEKTQAPADTIPALAQIVETQQQIQVRHLELDDAMTLVAERVVGIVRAAGAAIGMLDGNHVKYRAVAGLKTLPKETTVPREKALCLPCLQNSRVFRCNDVNQQVPIDAAECGRRGIAAMLVVPIFREGRVAGVIEVYHSAKNAFTDQDVHTCQLMAGLVTEALARDEEQAWKRSLASERAAMLEALEKLQPNLAALLNTAATKETALRPNEVAVEPGAKPTDVPAKPQAAVPTGSQPCRKCGHEIVAGEQFCGQCGSPRSSDYEPPSMQSKVASLWQMQESQKKEDSIAAVNGDLKIGKWDENAGESLPEDLAHSLEQQMPELFADSEEFDAPVHEEEDSAKLPAELIHVEHLAEDSVELSDEIEPQSLEAQPQEAQENTPETVALTKAEPAADWSSAASARNFLEKMAAAKPSPALLKFWNTRRGDIYLAVAVILVACVIRWGLWSNHSVTATNTPNTAAHRKSAEEDLPLFDRMLISLGLADPPDTPEDKGSPTVQVWIDTHTGLYYCAGADLYGKTPKGKLATQREAQLDQFQPAYRKACN